MTNSDAALQRGKELLEQEAYEAAIDVLLPCADAGLTEAEAAIGVLYMLGQGAPRDLRKAEIYLKRAAEKGSGIAAHNLGTFYMTCEPDMPLAPEQSRKWFKIAADMGFTPGGTLCNLHAKNL